MLLVCLVLPVTAHAQDGSSSQEQAISAEMLGAYPWLSDLNRADPKVAELVQERIPGIEYYAPALDALSKFPPEQQSDIVKMVAEGEPPDFAELISELRIPKRLAESILSELATSEADSDLEIPGYIEAMDSLRASGDISVLTFDGFSDYCPTTFKYSAIFVRTENAQANLAAAQANLAAAQERLQDLKEISDAQDKILGKLTGQ